MILTSNEASDSYERIFSKNNLLVATYLFEIKNLISTKNFDI